MARRFSMKNWKYLVITILVMVIVLGITTCNNDDSHGGPINLRGDVIIPIEVMIGRPVIADTDDLRGSGEISYQWQISDSVDGTFFDITDDAAVNDRFTVTGDANINRFLRVTVTREGRDGSRSSNAARIHAPELINSVIINFDGDNVTTGRNFNFFATVTYGAGSTDKFQQVIWSVTGSNNLNTFIGKYDGVLSVASNESASSLIIRAASIIDPSVFDVLTIPVGTTPLVLQLDDILDRNRFEVRDSDPSLNSGRQLETGHTASPPGGGRAAYFIANAKAPDRANAHRYEVYFYLNDMFIDATPYKFLSYEISGDSFAILDDIDEHYPRFRSAVVDVHDLYVQFQGSFAFRNVIDNHFSGETTWGTSAHPWGTVVVPIENTNIHAMPDNYLPVMGHMNVLALRYITKFSAPTGRLYFRNIQLHMTDPR
jgi:hypothetical protein